MENSEREREMEKIFQIYANEKNNLKLKFCHSEMNAQKAIAEMEMEMDI